MIKKTQNVFLIMMLCKGTALQVVLHAGSVISLRMLPEKYFFVTTSLYTIKLIPQKIWHGTAKFLRTVFVHATTKLCIKSKMQIMEMVDKIIRELDDVRRSQTPELKISQPERKIICFLSF